MLCATSTGLGNIVGAILRSSGGPNVNNHHKRNITAIGSAPRATAVARDTWPRILRNEWTHMRETLRKAFGSVNSPPREEGCLRHRRRRGGRPPRNLACERPPRICRRTPREEGRPRKRPSNSFGVAPG